MTKTRPTVTLSLIAVNVVVFLLTAAQAGNIAVNYRGSGIFDAFVLFSPLVALGEFERLVGSGFLHIGPLHLAVNMFALYIVGREVEIVLGKWRYIAVYGISLLGGSAAVMWMQAAVPTAGASGAVFGLFGALAIILLRLRQNATGVFVIIGINIFISVTIPGISLWGHLGGLATGAVAAAGLLYAPGWISRKGSLTAERASRIGIIALASVAIVVLASIAVRILELRGLMANIYGA
ncbi:hypothetical protein GCM10011410_15930 [Hoyosella rhizosphaerae]|uniref:Peptidase S54 rhomboid domain-containing protein n=2 Tax=Hoyosella rhizosphaerae TaxID=1755582 RepID=A0A916XCU7_9ACTN|nr:hypothetical protein GCM10011410_15930 [Hoyosella rhizosphaerae]